MPPAKQWSVPKRFLSDREISEIYGLGEAALKKLRMRGAGPEFRRFGHRTILYDVARLEEWIARQPKGGGL
jgi:predicted DNA-binding transcriptional regulator AlpA